MNVLSVFDGMACGRIALERVGIRVDNYYAFEIDKYAIKIATKNYPDIVEMGDVKNWKFFNEIEVPDLILAGFPCQGFSIAGKRLNFEDERSKLFFTLVDILNYWKAINPNLKFLFENVSRMDKKVIAQINELLGVEPIEINSALVSAQNRKRLYWTNIEGIKQPEDKGIVLADILDSGTGVIKSYGEYKLRTEKAMCLDANYWKGEDNHGQRTMVMVGLAEDIKGFDMTRRIYSPKGKSPTLSTMQGGHRHPKVSINSHHYRKLYPIECERLQTVPDNYTEGVSDTQRYKMLGNGMTVDVIAHFLRCLRQ